MQLVEMFHPAGHPEVAGPGRECPSLAGLFWYYLDSTYYPNSRSPLRVVSSPLPCAREPSTQAAAHKDVPDLFPFDAGAKKALELTVREPCG